MRGFLGRITIRTSGPMNAYQIRDAIEELIAQVGLEKGVAWIHAKGATPIIAVARIDALENLLKWLTRSIPVYGWRHGNAYAHLRSTITSSEQVLAITKGRLDLPENYSIYFIETRPVYNHKREIYIWLTTPSNP